MPNLFRQATEILAAKDAGVELTDQDREVWGAAIIPLNNPAYCFLQGIPVAECLEVLSALIEEVAGDN